MQLKLTPEELRLIVGRGPTLQEVHELQRSVDVGPMEAQVVIDGRPVGEWFPIVRWSVQRLPMWNELITLNMASRFELRVK